MFKDRAHLVDLMSIYCQLDTIIVNASSDNEITKDEIVKELCKLSSAIQRNINAMPILQAC